MLELGRLSIAGLLAALTSSWACALPPPNVDWTPQAQSARSPYPDFRRAQWIKVEDTEGKKFLAAVFRPKGKGRFPAVVLLHGGDGLNEAYLSLAQEIASAGFIVVAGCWQANNLICSEATAPGTWASDPTPHSGNVLVAFARSLKDVRSDRIGLYGLSRGGHAALWLASTGTRVAAVVVDAPSHEPSPQAIYPPPPKPVTVLSGLDSPVLMMHGTLDSVIPVDQSREYERAARELGKPVEVHYFDGLRHMPGLIDPHARKRGIQFLVEHLKK